MKQRRSEVFDSFAQIAIDEGLITEAEEAGTDRDDKDYRDTIEMLYNVKAEGDSKDHILDQAHPESPVIIAPSYDRLNGLVENLFERQDIMAGIALRDNRGNLTQHRYAQQELVDELVRIGFDMDNKDEDELRVLADSCSERMVKESFWPAALGLGSAIFFGYKLIKKHVLDEKTTQGLMNDGVNAIKSMLKASKSAKPEDMAVLKKAYASSYDLLKVIVIIRGIKIDDSLVTGDDQRNEIVNAAKEFKGDNGRAIQYYEAKKEEVLNDLAAAHATVGGNDPNRSNLPEFLADLRSLYRGVEENEFETAGKYIKTFMVSINTAKMKSEKVKQHAIKTVKEEAAKVKSTPAPKEEAASETSVGGTLQNLLWGE